MSPAQGRGTGPPAPPRWSPVSVSETKSRLLRQLASACGRRTCARSTPLSYRGNSLQVIAIPSRFSQKVQAATAEAPAPRRRRASPLAQTGIVRLRLRRAIARDAAAQCPPDPHARRWEHLLAPTAQSTAFCLEPGVRSFCRHPTQRRHVHYRLRRQFLQARSLILQHLEAISLPTPPCRHIPCANCRRSRRRSRICGPTPSPKGRPAVLSKCRRSARRKSAIASVPVPSLTRAA